VSNSLRGSLSARDVIDFIILSLRSDAGKNLIYILVEGQNDCKIYGKLFDQNKACVECANGKGQVSVALKELNAITKQVFGICDADFGHLQNALPSFQNLFFTDFHDIEMTMLSVDDVLGNALAECRFLGDTQAILQKALEETKFIGYVRWFNEVKGIGLDFQKTKRLGGFFRSSNNVISLDGDAYLDALNTRSEHKTKAVTLSDVTHFIQTHNTDDLFNLCNGHDVTAFMALAIEGKTSHDQFCSFLRVSFNIHHFRKTKLYDDILEWQTEHGFSVLLAESSS